MGRRAAEWGLSTLRNGSRTIQRLHGPGKLDTWKFLVARGASATVSNGVRRLLAGAPVPHPLLSSARAGPGWAELVEMGQNGPAHP